jgi:hypothetical protein
MNNPLQTFEPTKLPWLLPIKRAVAVSGLSRSTHLPHDQGAEAGRAEDAKLDPGADRKPASRWSRICRATAAKQFSLWPGLTGSFLCHRGRRTAAAV